MACDAAIVSAGLRPRILANRNERVSVHSGLGFQWRETGAVATGSAPIAAARRWLIGIATLLPMLAGCAAPSANSMGRRLQSIAGANETEAFRKADKKCNAYGRAAETVAYDGSAGMLTFRCIEP
jgi:hypothetical protein